MPLDGLTLFAGIATIVIGGLLAFIFYSSRKQSFAMQGIGVGDFIARIKEQENFLQRVKETPCWACGVNDKNVSGDLYEENEFVITCNQCGTTVTWKRGKKGWKMQTESQNVRKKLEEFIQTEKRREQQKEE